ncbi:MAG: ASKHA domain-containing protein, partial [Lachnospiraceae bacterium]|nr:ASKHA domain-containing protein [Lachnospiraceae bacterium]
MVLLRAAKEKQIKGSASDIQRNPARKASIQLNQTVSHDITNGEKTPHPDRIEYYAAVDIGTTTLSIEIYDHNGKCVGGCAENNAQGKLGSDVMMRLMHVSEGRQEILHALIRDQIYHQLKRLLTDIIGAVNVVEASNRIDGVHTEDGTDATLAHLRKISIVGNTVMCHLFLNKDATGLCGTPFRPGYQGSCRIFGKDLGWLACPDVEITVLPGIAAHVGADAAAVLMAERLWQKDRIQLAVDLGTNAEILLNNRGTLWVCSAAAGPAFEGKGISCGCRGGAGAVSGVKLNRANGNILLSVVPDSVTGKLLPRGICGSGLVDLIAALLENKLLQPDGYLLSRSEAKECGICDAFVQRLEGEDEERRFLLYDPLADKVADADRKQTKCLFVTQQDIRHFQLAKSGIQ